MPSQPDEPANLLYYGDNLAVMRESIKDESVDLVYLDPPFNSKRDYNLLFKSPKGKQSEAQIEAFEDTWHWNDQAEREFDELLRQPNTDVAEMMKALRSFLGENDLMAYLTMMGSRLLELHRVLKPTGSLYLHCDPTASHYLKVVMDGVFGKLRFQSEIVWKRYGAHSNANTYGAVHDVLLFYTKGERFTFNKQYEPHDEAYIKERFKFADPDGRRWAEQNLGNPAVRPNLMYPFTAKNGITYQPPANGWKYSQERMRQLDDENRLHYPQKEGGRLRLKSYQDELPGIQLQDVWTDLVTIGGTSPERLGYPTQKPLALLKRVIEASSNRGDVVLDPFCGCGTAVHAAQALKRRWIGIDITCLAIALIEKRLKDAFGAECKFEVHGTPKDLESARDLAARDKYQFQWWAVTLVDAQPFRGKKKGPDTGIDGLKFFHDLHAKDAMKVVVSVKGGGTLKPDDVRALNHVREREKAEIALLISLADPSPKMRADAASAGFYVGATGQRFARVQMLTIDGLLSGKERAEHPDYVPHVNYRRARRERPGQKALFGQPRGADEEAE